ncbi:MAG: AI-2E family transporter [Desulfitobacterium hafniense]|nr:AI-2E family transporter [Desulfitobacterium hafniense]
MKKEKWRWFFLITIVLLAGILVLTVKAVLSPFLLAFALAYLLSPIVEWLERHHLSRNWAITLVFIGILSGFSALLLFIIPRLYGELSKLATVLPGTMQSIEQLIQGLRANYTNGLPNRVVMVLDGHLNQGEVFLAERLNEFLSDLPEMIASMTLLILSPIMAIYFLADWKKFQEGLIRIVPQRNRLDWQRLLQDINHVIRRFVRGHLTVATFVGVLVGVGVKLIGMDYAFLIGFICGVFDLIPYFGPLIGAIPSVILGLIISPWMALKVAIVIMIVQQLESNVISPKLMGDSVGLHPLWIVFALLAGGELAGFWGMLLAVPFTAVLRVILRHIYFRLVSPEV